MSSTQHANQDRHYILLTVAVIVGMIGVYLRFADFHYSSAIANVILVLGVIIALKAVFSILK